MGDGFFPGTHGILLYFLSEVGEITEMYLKEYDFKLGFLLQFHNFFLKFHVCLPQFLDFLSHVVFLQLKVRFQVVDADIDVIESCLTFLSELLFHDGKVVNKFMFFNLHFDLVVPFMIFKCSDDVGDLLFERAD